MFCHHHQVAPLSSTALMRRTKRVVSVLFFKKEFFVLSQNGYHPKEDVEKVAINYRKI
jgi:hypothetical protein